MKTYFRDFSMQGSELTKGCSDLGEVINNRQEKFYKTVEYNKVNSKIKALLDSILPGNEKTVRDLCDEILSLESACFDAAYLDGMSDLMATITMNKLGITKVEYIDYKAMDAERRGQ